jgi:transcriptional regulator with XRE-family HTH domain
MFSEDADMFGSSKILGNYLKNKRIEAGLNQNEVAKALGYKTAQFVSNWERGLCSPPAEKFYEIIKLYKLNKNEFVEFLLDLEESGLRSLVKQKSKRLNKPA